MAKSQVSNQLAIRDVGYLPAPELRAEIILLSGECVNLAGATTIPSPSIISTLHHESEFTVLTTKVGRALLAEVNAVSKPSLADIERWRGSAGPEMASAALRLADTRRRGVAKFSRSSTMWFDAVGLEQATGEIVAGHKAKRFAASRVVDLCCGIGGDALAMAGAGSPVITVDRDAGMVRRAAWNARAYGCGDRILCVRSRAETIAIPSGSLVHVDPDRRVHTNRRARCVEQYAPGLDFLKGIVATARGGAIKLGPASDFADHFGGDGFEVEVTSLRGECKEATVWFGDLVTCRRRATALPSGATWTDRDGPAGRAGLGPLDDWIFEPDPALIRSGLLDGFANAAGAGRFAEGIDLLTATHPIDSPLLTAFAFEASYPLDVKTLRREIARRGVGRLEIKTRGIDLKPEEFRNRLRLQGPHEATLFLIGGPGRARAIFARRPAPC